MIIYLREKDYTKINLKNRNFEKKQKQVKSRRAMERARSNQYPPILLALLPSREAVTAKNRGVLSSTVSAMPVGYTVMVVIAGAA